MSDIRSQFASLATADSAQNHRDSVLKHTIRVSCSCVSYDLGALCASTLANSMSRRFSSSSLLLIVISPLLLSGVLLACVNDRSSDSSSKNGNASSSGSTSSGGNVGDPGPGATSPNPDGGAPIQNPGSGGTINITSETVDVQGTPRSFVLAAPSTYDATKSYPLVLALHGDGESGSEMQQMLHFEDASGQNAFVAYPTGTSSGWDLYDPSAQNADAMFITTLVDSLRTRFSIDQTHVFGLGLSSGAFMINQLACRHSSLFRGIAPHSGGAPSEPRDPSAGTWGNGFVKCVGQTNPGPAAMVMHGTADTMVPLESGEFTANYWATVNGCSTSRTPIAGSVCSKQESCPGNAPVVFCPITNLGHQLWSDAAKSAWGFFSGL